MANKKFTCSEVIGLLFADSDSEGENLTLEEDDSDSERDSHDASSLSGIAAVGHTTVNTQAQAQTHDHLPGGSGTRSGGMGGCVGFTERGENSAGTSVSVQSFYPERHNASMRGSGAAMPCSSVQAHINESNSGDRRGRRGRSVCRRAGGCRRGRRGGLNRAESNDELFNTLRNGRGGRAIRSRSVCRRGARGRGNRGRQNRAGNDSDDDGWVYLRGEEVYEEWIKPFDERVGYRGDRELSHDSRPIDFLSLFLTNDFWNLITVETNRYAHQYLASHELTPSSRFHAWYDVTVPEMKAFLSLHLSMGLVHKSEIEDYWAGFWPTHTPGFGKVMCRNRFEIILSFFHFANNEGYVGRGQPGYDRLFKVRPIIDLIIPRFSAVHGPRKELSLDEMTIAFKGKSTLKLYNPNKPDKYGFKAFVLSDAKSGYVLEWSLYTGKHGDEATDVGATHLLVRQLMSEYMGKGHELYMDSYYTSPAVANELADHDTGVCGTVSSQRRGMPKAMQKTELSLARGDDPVFMRNGKLLACAWRDIKRFHMLSTLDGNLCVQKRIRSKDTDSGFWTINKPVCVDRYNSFMGGVDTADQRMKTYLFPHRSKKWYFRIVNAILSISMVNSHIIYCSMTAGPPKPLKAFVQDIITSLLEGFSKRENKIRGRPSAERGERPQRLTERHWLFAADDRPDCAVCSDRSRPKGRHQTHYRCKQCGVGLCSVPCNERFHTLTNYKQCHLDR